MDRHNRSLRRHARRHALAGAVGAIAVVLAGCGGSSSSGSSSGKSPILIGVEAPIKASAADFSGDVAGVLAAANTINANGGIHGRKIKVDVCNTQDLVTEEVSCARKLVSDGVVATVGQLYANTGAVETYMSQHHVADIEYTGPLPNAYSSKTSFPLTWEVASWMPCFSKEMAAQAGGNRVLNVSINVPATATIDGWEKAYAKSQGLTYLNPVSLSPTSTDFSSVVASATQQHANWIVAGVFQNQGLLKAISEAGAPVSSCVALGFTQPGGWQNLGSATKKLYIGATFKAFSATGSAPLLKTLTQSINAYNKSGQQLASSATLNPSHLQGGMPVAWLGAWGFAQAARTITGQITPASVVAAMSHATINNGGVIPNVDFAKPPETGSPFTRIWNSSAYLWKYNPDSNSYSQVAAIPNTIPGVFH